MRYMRGYISPALRKQVAERDEYTCQMCGKKLPFDDTLHLDHIIPAALGGESTLSNLRVLCRDCNSLKADLLVGENDLRTWCEQNNRNDILNEWSYEKNKGIRPEDITYKNVRYVWWKCSACGKEWYESVGNRTKHICFCPYCVGKFPGNDLAACCPSIASEWDYEKNGSLTPHDVDPWSRCGVWWKCHVCGCEWKSTVKDHVLGDECPSCSHTLMLSTNALARRNPAMAKELHPKKNKGLSAEHVSIRETKTVWWKCSLCGHEFQMSIRNRYDRKTPCPVCHRYPWNNGYKK